MKAMENCKSKKLSQLAKLMLCTRSFQRWCTSIDEPQVLMVHAQNFQLVIVKQIYTEMKYMPI